MKLSRIKALRKELDAERISMGELAEIQGAFAELPVESLRDLPENALASDMLDELETAEKKKYNWTSTGPGGCDAHNIEHPCGKCLNC